MNQLRLMADPEITSVGPSLSGGSSSFGSLAATTRPSRVKEDRTRDVTVTQNTLSSFVKNSMDVTVQTVLSADRRSVRVSMTPVFNTVGKGNAPPVVTTPIIPGD
jgi:hypothetical protein